MTEMFLDTILPLLLLLISVMLGMRAVTDKRLTGVSRFFAFAFVIASATAITATIIEPSFPQCIIAGAIALFAGMFVFFITSLQPITSNEDSERLSEEYIRTRSNIFIFSIFNSLRDLVMTIKRDGMVMFMNQAAVDRLGDHVGMQCLELLKCEADDCRDCMVRMAEEITPEHPAVRQQKIRDRDYEITYNVLQGDAEGKVILVARDITDRLQAERQIRINEKMASLGQLVAGVAHEINSPLASILANHEFVELFRPSIIEFIAKARELVSLAESGDDALLPEYILKIQSWAKANKLADQCEEFPPIIEDIGEATAQIQRLVRDLKDFSHQGSEQAKRTDFNRLIRLTLRLAAHEIKRYELDLKLDNAIPQITCLPQQLKQAFLNLIVNAAQAMKGKEDGKLSIKTSFSEGKVSVVVADNGPGVPEDIKSRIFDPFFTTKDIGEGTGLGLSVVYGIIQNHGGSIECRSEQGQGAEFAITLPRMIPSEREAILREA